MKGIYMKPLIFVKDSEEIQEAKKNYEEVVSFLIKRQDKLDGDLRDIKKQYWKRVEDVLVSLDLVSENQDPHLIVRDDVVYLLEEEDEKNPYKMFPFPADKFRDYFE